MSEDESQRADFEGVEEESLAELLRETRQTNERLIDALESADDKAMRTSRTSLIVLGLLLTAASVGGVELINGASDFAIGLTLGGVGLLILSTLFTMAAYSVSEYPVGIGNSHAKYVHSEHPTPDEWRGKLVREYLSWNEEVTSALQETTLWFFLGQVTLLLGLGLLSFVALNLLISEIAEAVWIKLVAIVFLSLGAVIIGSSLWDAVTK